MMTDQPDDLIASVQAALTGSKLYPVPPQDLFEGEDYYEAPDLEALAQHVAEKHPRFRVLADLEILYRWKRSGGKSTRSKKLGACAKISGLFHFETRADFVIWLAADHCRSLELTRHQVEALLVHELCHIGADEKGKLGTIGHDVEEFGFVVEHYGLWKRDVLDFVKATRQLTLDDVA